MSREGGDDDDRSSSPDALAAGPAGASSSELPPHGVCGGVGVSHPGRSIAQVRRGFGNGNGRSRPIELNETTENKEKQSKKKN
jgi:hypothetical protein